MELQVIVGVDIDDKAILTKIRQMSDHSINGSSIDPAIKESIRGIVETVLKKHFDDEPAIKITFVLSEIEIA